MPKNSVRAACAVDTANSDRTREVRKMARRVTLASVQRPCRLRPRSSSPFEPLRTNVGVRDDRGLDAAERSSGDGLPELRAVRAVVGPKQELAGDAAEIARVRVPRAWIDVPDQLRSSRRAVAPPGLFTGARGVGTEEERPADPCERVAGGDLLDELRPRASAVGFPERTLVARIEGAEEERAADVLQAV